MPEFDVNAVISRLFIYPIKSCAGVALEESLLLETGLQWDRAWMVVDESGQFLSQRELPAMALIAPQIKHDEMVLRAPGMLALHVALDGVEQACQVRVWDHVCAAYDMGAVAAQWLSDFLMPQDRPGKSDPKLRLVRFDPEHRRASNALWTQGRTALNQFSDGFPLLVLGEASLADLNVRLQQSAHEAIGIERFRPNIVLRGLNAYDEDYLRALRLAGASPDSVDLLLVKPCSRCSMVNIHPQTAQIEPHISHALAQYRQSAVLGGAVSFGMNAIIAHPAERLALALAVGQSVSGQFNF